jgi:hypothetical protein
MATTMIHTMSSMKPMMTEAQFQQRITDLCDWLGLKWHHETDSRKSKKGFPDLVICGPNHLIWVELKSNRGRVTKAQQEWLDALEAANQQAFVWRPDDWPTIQKMLTVLSQNP